MKACYLTTICVFLVTYSVSGQSNESKTSINVKGFGIETLNYMSYSEKLNNTDWRELLNKPEAFFMDDTLKYEDNSYYNCCNDKKGVWVNLETDKKNREVQFGLWYNKSWAYHFSSKNVTTFISGDTVFSDPFLTITKDSGQSTSFWTNDHYEDVSISASYLFTTNSDRRFSFYAGAGLEAGYSINSRIITERRFVTSSSYRLNQTGNPFHNFINLSNNVNETTIRTPLKNIIFIRPVVPIGINFRIFNKQRILNHLSISLLSKGGVLMQFFPDKGHLIIPYCGFGIGMIYKL